CSLSIGGGQVAFGCNGASRAARGSHRPWACSGLLHPLFSAGGVAPRVVPLVQVRPRPVRPGVLEHDTGPAIRIDHEPGAGPPPLPARRPLLAAAPGPDAFLLRIPPPGDAPGRPNLRSRFR